MTFDQKISLAMELETFAEWLEENAPNASQYDYGIIRVHEAVKVIRDQAIARRVDQITGILEE